MRETRNFKESEFNCKCPKCEKKVTHRMVPYVMEKLQTLRTMYGSPLFLTSAYRCHEHPIEAAKDKPGTHAQGLAVDILVSDAHMAFVIITMGLDLGATGFAYGENFVHLDWRKTTPVTWRY